MDNIRQYVLLIPIIISLYNVNITLYTIKIKKEGEVIPRGVDINFFRRAKQSTKNVIWALFVFCVRLCVWNSLHYDNAPCHTALVLRDFWLLNKFKSPMLRRRFDKEESLEGYTGKILFWFLTENVCYRTVITLKRMNLIWKNK